MMKLLRRLPTSRRRAIIFASAFVVLGLTVVVATHAAGSVTALEAESGTLATCASTVSDAGASGGQAVSFASCAPAQTASSVSQYGITWTFSASKTVGQFANGDWWVLGPVTITSVTPAYASGLNGWQVNPPLTGNRVLGDDPCVNNDCGGQSFDSGSGDYWAPSMLPVLPYTANGGQSIVKAISRSGHGASCGASNACLQTAAILTVVSTVPPGNGATVFRPPYVGTNKPYFSTAALDAQVPNLPRLASTSTIDTSLPTIQAALDTVKKPDIGYHIEELNDLHPIDNVLNPGDTNPYAPGISAVYVDAVMRALVAKTGDDESLRRQLLIALTQRGIDNWGMRAMGMHWYGAGGTNMGARPPIVFAAWMLNDQTMKNTLSSSGRNDFAETGSVQPSHRADGQPVWGQIRGTATDYWTNVAGAVDSFTGLDPYLFVDGGYAPSTSYQQCCTAAAIKGDALMAHLIPGMEAIWNDTPTMAFAKRWVNHGMLTSNDPCAPTSQGGGQSGSGCVLDPDLTAGSTMTSFTCQAGKQCGRFPAADGTHMEGSSLVPGGNGTPGDWGYTDLQNKIWFQYWP